MSLLTVVLRFLILPVFLALMIFPSGVHTSLEEESCMDCEPSTGNGPNCVESDDECHGCQDENSYSPLSEKTCPSVEKDTCVKDEDCSEGSFCFNKNQCEPCVNCHTLLRNQSVPCAKTVLECGTCFQGQEMFNSVDIVCYYGSYRYAETLAQKGALTICVQRCRNCVDQTYMHHMFAIAIMVAVDVFVVVFMLVKFCSGPFEQYDEYPQVFLRNV